MKKNKKQLLNRIALGLVLSTSVCGTVFAVPSATEVPTSPVNVTGANTWVTTNTTDPKTGAITASVMKITQDTATTNAHINWQTFNIGSAATVNIVQNSSNQTLVNQVVSNSMSEIYGKMNASGNVVLVNPNGIILAKGSEINAGGFAAYASAGTKLTDTANRINEGNIIADGTINVGVGIAKTLAAKFGVTNFAVGLGSASSFGNANKIALVANGDVTVNEDAKLTAVDTTTMSGSSKQGAEGFNMGGVTSSSNGAIYIRPDANDNDYGQVHLNGKEIFRSPNIKVYYNADVKDTTATTNDGVLYNKKDYANDGGKSWTGLIDTSEVIVSVDGTYVKKTDAEVNTDGGTITYITPKDPYKVETNPVVGYALVHNMAQLQDIDTNINGKKNDDGNLNGTYALGKDLYAQEDTVGNDYAYVLKHHGNNENPIIFTTVDGTNLTAISGKDSGTFSVEGTTGEIIKTLHNGEGTVRDAVIHYNKTAGSGIPNSVSATYDGVTYSYNGGTIKDATGATYTVNNTNNGYEVTKSFGGKTTQITDTKTIATIAGLPIALNEFADQTDLDAYLKNYTGDVAKDFAHMNTKTWNNSQGFDPIGSKDASGTVVPFQGTIFGIGGDVIHIGDKLSEVHTIYDLPINLPTTDDVGLVGWGYAANIEYVQEANTSITGHSNVGGLMGRATNGSTISDSANMGAGINGVLDITKDSGYVRTTGTTADQITNIGGLVGDLEGSTINESANSATVIGQIDPITDLNVKNVGGLAGTANNSKIYRSVNKGNVFGEEKTGGIVGSATGTTIGGTAADLDDPTSTVYNNGRITGTKDTGGIAGYGSDIHMYGVYNTNEDSALSGNSQYVINPDGTIIGQNPEFETKKGNKYDSSGHLVVDNTGLATNGIYSDKVLSVYGVITGNENTGGLVGDMESTSTIDTAYNAGNVTGKDIDGGAKATNTGGLVGKLNVTTEGTAYTSNIKNAYNGDNNTVIREDLGTVPDKIKGIAGTEFDPVQNGNSVPNKYTYNVADASYYSFYTMSGTTKTYYYFIPAGGKTEAGADGAFATYDANTNSIKFVKNADLPASGDRIYTNRVGYKDANITGTTNVGGLFGEMDNGIVTTTYDTGTVKGTDTATTGALAGTKTGGTLSNSFFADNSSSDKTTNITKAYSGQANAVGGTGTVDTTTVKGGALNDWRKSQNIKDLTGESFVGDAAAVDKTTGYQQFKDGSGNVYYWSTKSNVYYYDNMGNKVTYLTYDKLTGKYYTATDTEKEHPYTVSGDATQQNLHPDETEEKDSAKTRSSIYVYTDVTFTDGTEPALKLSYVKHASNETSDFTWIEYPDETTPLLQHFMFPDNITRNFVYDAKTHNLKTDDVNNVYGRADFTDGVSGKNVNNAGQAQSADPNHKGESEYFYDSTAIWSPQHGYKINANVSITVKSTDLNVEIEGTRTYGDAGNTTGYYVMVPYKEVQTDGNGVIIRDPEGNPLYKDEQYAFYKVIQDGKDAGTEPYVAMTDADWTYGGIDYRTDPAKPTKADLKALCDAKASYMATFNGVTALEAVDLNQAVQTVIQALKVNYTDPTKKGYYTYTSGGNALTQIITKNDSTTYPLGDQSLQASSTVYAVEGIQKDANTGLIKNKDTANIGGISNDDDNYNITYTGGLTVNKADLYYTYDGTRVYGDENSTGNHVYTLVGIDKHDDTTDSTTSSVDGYLKSFDIGKIGLDANNVIMNGTSIDGGLTPTSYNMRGTPKANTNITDNGEQDITAGKAGTYYHVMVDADGNVLKYKVTQFNPTTGAATVATGNTGTDVAYINRNYNMVWRSDTNAEKVRTTTTGTITNNLGETVKTSIISKGEENTGYAGAGTALKPAISTEEITPAALEVTVTGKRTYGDLMIKDDYTKDATSLTDKMYNVTGSGLKNINTDSIATIVDSTAMGKIISGIEAQAGNHTANQINEATNAGEYALIDNTTQTVSNIDVSGKVKQHYNILNSGNYDYTITNGKHKETINPEAITITTDANREYGDAPDANGVGTNTHVTSFTVTTPANIETWDQDKFDNNMNTWKNWLKDKSNVKDHVLADGYGTLGSTDAKNTYKSTGAVVIDAENDDHHDQKTISATLGNNYAITYQDKLDITKAPLTITVTGKRQYGDSMVNDGKVNYIASTNGTVVVPKNLPNEKVYDVNLSGVKTATGDSADSLLNEQGIKDKLLTVDNTDGSATVVGRRTDVNTNIDSPYNKSTAAVFELSNTNSSTDTNTVLKTDANNDYYVANDGNNSLLIVPRKITITQTNEKLYGTGAEHTTYGDFTVDNAAEWNKDALQSSIMNTGNTSTRSTPVGSYDNLVTAGFNPADVNVTKNYAPTYNIVLNVKPDTFTYTADQTSYWQYQHIPAQTGKVTNSYGEDVSDLAGNVTWPTPADGKVVGFFPIWGRGSNDNSGNYFTKQAPTNPTALEVKKVPKNEQTDSALNENLEGAWQSFRRPLLDIMYLTIKDNGFKSWDNGVFVTANPYVPAGDKTNYGIITFNGQVLK